jgi:hypothetical protein
MSATKGKLTVDKERGVIYFHDEKGGCLLRLEGLEGVDPVRKQIDIRLRPLATDITRSRDYNSTAKIAEVVG